MRIVNIHLSVTVETDQPADTIAPKGLYLTDEFQDQLKQEIKKAVAEDIVDIDYPDELDEGPKEIGIPNLYHLLVG